MQHCTIRPLTLVLTEILPLVTRTVTIDGTSHRTSSGENPTPPIILDGSNAPNPNGDGFGIDTTAPDVVIKGLTLRNFKRCGITAHGPRLRIAFVHLLNNGLYGINVGVTAVESVLGDAADGRVVVDSHGNDGMHILAPRVKIVSAYVGVGVDGNTVGAIRYKSSGKHGINVGTTADDCTIGDASAPPVVVGDSTNVGIAIFAPGAKLLNVYSGVGSDGITDVGNQEHGIYIDEQAEKCTVGDVSAGDNGRVLAGRNVQSGIYVEDAPSTLIQNVYAGVGSDGKSNAGNTYYGVSVEPGTEQCLIGNAVAGVGVHGRVTAGWNDQSGVHSERAGAVIVNTFAGVSSDGAAEAPNTLLGIVLTEPAVGTIIGGTATKDGLVFASRNRAHGIEVYAASVTIANAAVGTHNLAGFVNYGNYRCGILVTRTAVDCRIGDPDAGDLGRVAAGYNQHHGIRTFAQRTTISNSMIEGNFGDGIRVEKMTCNPKGWDVELRAALHARGVPDIKYNCTEFYKSDPSFFKYDARYARVGLPVANGMVYVAGNAGSGIVVDAQHATIANVESNGNLNHGIVIGRGDRLGEAPVDDGCICKKCDLANIFENLLPGGGFKKCRYAHVGVGSPAAGQHGRVVVTNSKSGHGILIAGGKTIVANAHVGVGQDGITPGPNNAHGIVVLLNVDAVEIGTARAFTPSGVTGRVVSSGNKRNGIQISGFDVLVTNTYVGVANDGVTRVPNRGNGIQVDGGGNVGFGRLDHRSSAYIGQSKCTERCKLEIEKRVERLLTDFKADCGAALWCSNPNLAQCMVDLSCQPPLPEEKKDKYVEIAAIPRDRFPPLDFFGAARRHTRHVAISEINTTRSAYMTVSNCAEQCLAVDGNKCTGFSYSEPYVSPTDEGTGDADGGDGVRTLPACRTYMDEDSCADYRCAWVDDACIHAGATCTGLLKRDCKKLVPFNICTLDAAKVCHPVITTTVTSTTTTTTTTPTAAPVNTCILLSSTNLETEVEEVEHWDLYDRGEPTGLVVASGNGDNGVSTNGGKVKYQNLYAGIGSDGKTAVGNGENGLFLFRAAGLKATVDDANRLDGLAKISYVGDPYDPESGKVVASGNIKHGIEIADSHGMIRNTYAGVSADGMQAVGNGLSGIVIRDTASYVELGCYTGGVTRNVDCGDEGFDPNVVASANGLYGIEAHGQRLRAGFLLVGVAKDGSPNSSPGLRNGDPLDSSGGGVFVAKECKHCAFGSSPTGNSKRSKPFRNVVSGNAGSGFRVHAANVTISDTLIGVAIDPGTGQQIRAPNGRHGIELEDEALGAGEDFNVLEQFSADSTQTTTDDDDFVQINMSYPSTLTLENSVVGGNFDAGVYPVDSDKPIKMTGTTKIHSNEDPQDPLQNNWGGEICASCTCAPLSAASSNQEWEVNCDTMLSREKFNTDDDLKRIDYKIIVPSGFSRSSLPGPLTSIRMINVGLTELEWGTDDLDTSELKTVMLANNERLNPLPSGHVFDKDAFNSLESISLRNTDLSLLTDGTFAGLGETLVSLDITQPSKPPNPNVTVNLTGMKKLAVVLWYNNSWCPKGFYATARTPLQWDIGVCARCPAGTAQLKDGMHGIPSCLPCESGFEDADKDPTTECTKLKEFSVTSFDYNTSNPDYRYTDATRQQIYAVGETYSFPPVNSSSVEVLHAALPLEYTMKPVVPDCTANGNECTPFAQPPGFLIDPTNGFIQGTPLARTGTFKFALHAVDSRGETAPMQAVVIEVKWRDTDINQPESDANGPNGKGCNEATEVGERFDDDGDPFNGVFTCKCKPSHMGDNCETERPEECEPDESNVSGECKLLKLGTNGTRLRNDFKYTVPSDGKKYGIDESYLISPKLLIKEQTTVTKGSLDELQYALDFKGPQPYLQPYNIIIRSSGNRAGDTMVTFTEDEIGKEFEVDVRLRDAAGSKATLETIVFTVASRDVENLPSASGPNNMSCGSYGTPVDNADEFDGMYSCECIVTYEGENCDIEKDACKAYQSLDADTGVCRDFTLVKNLDASTSEPVRSKGNAKEGIAYTDPSKTTVYEAGIEQVYRVAPLEINTTGTEFTQGGLEDVKYLISDTCIDPKGGPNTCPGLDGTSPFFLDSGSGTLLATFNFNETLRSHENCTGSCNQTYRVTMKVADKGGAIRELETWSMVSKYKDVLIPTFGPNGKDCRTPKQRVDSGDVYDGIFECNCMADPGGFPPNCEYDPAKAAKAAQKENDQVTAGVGGSLGGILLAVVAVIAVMKLLAYQEKMRPADFNELFQAMLDSGEIESKESHIAKSMIPREINRKALQLVEVIGNGQFGEVWKSILDETASGGNPGYLVAAKTVIEEKASEDASRELKAEAVIMAQVSNHPNLVSLVGVITRGDPLVLIVSFCEHGSLLGMLREQASHGDPINLTTKLKLSHDVALGMRHLSTLHFIHRDLAARNVLVATGMVGQVADFGLSRGTTLKAPKEGDEGEEEGVDDDEDGEYYRSQQGVFPIRWTSPEAMESLKFSFASDVWSFGIVMVEIYQDGIKPYHDLDNQTVMTKVMAGYKHPQPPGCTSAVYEMLCECWQRDPKGRPDFTRVGEVIEFNLKKRRLADKSSLTPGAHTTSGFKIGRQGSMNNHSASSIGSRGSSAGGSGGGISSAVIAENQNEYADGGVPVDAMIVDEHNYTDMGFGGGNTEVVKDLQNAAYEDHHEGDHTAGIIKTVNSTSNPMYKMTQDAMAASSLAEENTGNDQPFGFDDADLDFPDHAQAAGRTESYNEATQNAPRKTLSGNLPPLPVAPLRESSEFTYVDPTNQRKGPAQVAAQADGYISLDGDEQPADWQAPPVAKRSRAQAPPVAKRSLAQVLPVAKRGPSQRVKGGGPYKKKGAKKKKK